MVDKSFKLIPKKEEEELEENTPEIVFNVISDATECPDPSMEVNSDEITVQYQITPRNPEIYRQLFESVWITNECFLKDVYVETIPFFFGLESDPLMKEPMNDLMELNIDCDSKDLETMMISK